MNRCKFVLKAQSPPAFGLDSWRLSVLPRIGAHLRPSQTNPKGKKISCKPVTCRLPWKCQTSALLECCLRGWRERWFPTHDRLVNMPEPNEKVAGPTGRGREAIGVHQSSNNPRTSCTTDNLAQLKRPTGKRDPMEKLLKRITRLKFVNSGVDLMNHTFS